MKEFLKKEGEYKEYFMTCQDCKHCKVSHDLHHSYLYCDKHKGCIDKNIFLCYECDLFER